jgi:hypothetical protein
MRPLISKLAVTVVAGVVLLQRQLRICRRRRLLKSHKRTSNRPPPISPRSSPPTRSAACGDWYGMIDQEETATAPHARALTGGRRRRLHPPHEHRWVEPGQPNRSGVCVTTASTPPTVIYQISSGSHRWRRHEDGVTAELRAVRAAITAPARQLRQFHRHRLVTPCRRSRRQQLLIRGQNTGVTRSSRRRRHADAVGSANGGEGLLAKVY